jgi:hypothetical protein
MQHAAGFFSADLQVTSFHASVRPAYIGGLAGNSVASDIQYLCLSLKKIPDRHFKPKLPTAKFQFPNFEILLLLLRLGSLCSQLYNKL